MENGDGGQVGGTGGEGFGYLIHARTHVHIITGPQYVMEQ